MTVFIITLRTTGKYPTTHIMGAYTDDIQALHRKSVVESEIMILGEQGTDYQKEVFGYGCVIGMTTLENNSDLSWPFEEQAKTILNNEAVVL